MAAKSTVTGKREISFTFLRKTERGIQETIDFASLTSMLRKIMEQIHVEEMLSCIQEEEVVQDRQHGFTKYRLCQTNLVDFCDGVRVAVDKERTNDIIYLDFCKVFDMIQNYIPISKL